MLPPPSTGVSAKMRRIGPRWRSASDSSKEIVQLDSMNCLRTRDLGSDSLKE